MSGATSTKCNVCQKQFSAVYNLKKHARKFHPDQVNSIVPKKIFKYQCTECHRNFTLLKNFNYHKKSHKNPNDSVDTSLTTKHNNAVCPICKFAASKEKLISHFEAEHGIQCVDQSFEFNSFEEFSMWKSKMEHDTKSKYVVERGSQSTKDGTKTIKYCCHRSGKYVAEGKGLRRLKTQGTKKINGFCPARLKIIINKNKQCKVSFINQHVGHDNDLRHLSLTPQERNYLATKLTLKIPFSQILNEVRESVTGSQVERIHLLRRKDLCNIERSLKESSGCVVFYEPQDGQDLVVNEDSNSSEVAGITTGLTLNEELVGGTANTKNDDAKHLAKEKQKLIDNFTQLVKSITSMEQLDAAKKVLISLGPMLEAMATKDSSRTLCTPFRYTKKISPSNKKVTPQRGKAHSANKNTTFNPTNK